ncbi:MAG TPA: imidazole glycerol phosphate synthase subunit HisH [Acidimicrobiales bacterium]|nr:imidazole glycerol phosphate synthase subunit HisH [Acidimicrobiales bacterium]
MSPRIAVLDYGIGNLRSAEKALQHVGADAALTTDPDEAADADGVVLPGVGAFGRCMEALRASGHDSVATAAVERGVPLLAVCVGLQLLYDGSDESPGVAGLGVFPGTVARLPEGVRRPQMQWNQLVVRPGAGRWLGGPDAGGPGPWVYFVHGYAAPDGPDVAATCDHGGPVVAALERGRVWATQFHPEKSGPAGLAILSAFAAEVATGAAVA